jgi:hypothetical protein
MTLGNSRSRGRDGPNSKRTLSARDYFISKGSYFVKLCIDCRSKRVASPDCYREVPRYRRKLGEEPEVSGECFLHFDAGRGAPEPVADQPTAMLRPMPRLPPVTTATRPLRSNKFAHDTNLSPDKNRWLHCFGPTDFPAWVSEDARRQNHSHGSAPQSPGVRPTACSSSAQARAYPRLA